MATFNISMIPTSGQQLLASASATSPLIIDEVIGDQTAYTDSQIEMYGGDPSHFTKTVEGSVDSVSSANNVAKIVVGFAPVETTGVALHTVIIVAHTATVTKRVLCAVSDGVHTLHVYSQQENIISQRSELAFQFSIESGTPITAPTFSLSEYVSTTELERLVTAHKAGTQDEGDDQWIRGVKTFKDNTVFDGNVDFSEQVVVNGNMICGNVAADDITCYTVHITDGLIECVADSENTTFAVGMSTPATDVFSYVYFENTGTTAEPYGCTTIGTTSANSSMSNDIKLYYTDEGANAEISIKTKTLILDSQMVKPLATYGSQNRSFFGTDNNRWYYIYATNMSVAGTAHIATVDATNLNSTTINATTVNATNLNGVMPSPDESTGGVVCPVGAIILAAINGSAGNLKTGETFSIPNITVYSVKSGNIFTPDTSKPIVSAGTYKVLNGLDFSTIGTTAYATALIMRIA